MVVGKQVVLVYRAYSGNNKLQASEAKESDCQQGNGSSSILGQSSMVGCVWIPELSINIIIYLVVSHGPCSQSRKLYSLRLFYEVGFFIAHSLFPRWFRRALSARRCIVSTFVRRHKNTILHILHILRV